MGRERKPAKRPETPARERSCRGCGVLPEDREGPLPYEWGTHCPPDDELPLFHSCSDDCRKKLGVTTHRVRAIQEPNEEINLDDAFDF